MHVIVCGSMGSEEVREAMSYLVSASISHELNNSKIVLDLLYENNDYADNELNAFIVEDGLTEHVTTVAQMIDRIES